jgi:hypothetical protein
MRIEIFIAILLVTTSLSGQPGLSYSQLEYNGRVKSVLEEKLYAVFENDSLVRYDYELFGSDKLFFDTIGRVKVKFDYKPARYVDTLEVKKVWKYFYSEGRLDSIYHDPPDTTKRWKYDKKYFYHYRNDSTTIIHKPRSRNDLEEITKTNFVDTIRHYRISSMKYPSTGNIDMDIISKSLLYTEIHQKDIIGRIEKSLHYRRDSLKRIELFTYIDKFPNPIREHQFFIPAELSLDNSNYIVDYKYELNEYGDVIERNYLDPNDGYKVWNTYTYEYDDYKNWIVRETFIEGKLKKVDRRTFEYY